MTINELISLSYVAYSDSASHQILNRRSPESTDKVLKARTAQALRAFLCLKMLALRVIASTALNEHGFSPDVIEAALAHVDKNEVRRAYLEQRRPLMQWWPDFMKAADRDSLLEGDCLFVRLKHE